MNRTLFLALVGVAAGTGAAMLLMPRTRNRIASDARGALGYAGNMASDYAGEYLPGTRRPRRRKAARAATKRKLVRRGGKSARAA